MAPLRSLWPVVVAALLGCGHELPPAPVAPANAPPASFAAAETAPATSTSVAATPTVGSADPPATDEAALRKLSQAWAKDAELMQSGHKPADDLSRCPAASHDMRPASRAVVPASFVRFEGIATRACDAVLWVYLGCTDGGDDGTSCQTWRERLVLEPVGTGAARVIGNVESRMGSNSGGLFVPFAFTRDGGSILLEAWMFSPGAGGGAVDYGVGVIARSTSSEAAPIDVQPFPARGERYYGDFGCAIGVAASDKTPSYTQPGFPADNGGALVVVDLSTLRPRTVLAERDTTYAVTGIDEKARKLDVEVTSHAFGKDCPREEGALSCSKSTTVKRRLALPACPAPH